MLLQKIACKPLLITSLTYFSEFAFAHHTTLKQKAIENCTDVSDRVFSKQVVADGTLAVSESFQ